MILLDKVTKAGFRCDHGGSPFGVVLSARWRYCLEGDVVLVLLVSVTPTVTGRAFHICVRNPHLDCSFSGGKLSH